MRNSRTGSRLARVVGAIALSSTATGLSLLNAPAASAQAAYGSYVGIGGSFGLTDNPDNTDGSSSSRAGGVVAARYRILELPISLRAQALIGDSTAIVPTVSYDIPLSWQTTAYIGAGVAIQNSETSATPVGNKTSFAIQPGIDHVFPNSNLVLFGNAVIAFDAYRDSGGTAAAIQGGLGWNFGER
jgi:opacity protein-like surface antigen